MKTRKLSGKLAVTAMAYFLGFFQSRAQGTLHFVDVNSASPSPPYTSWNTAAQNIQSAVDAASPGDTVLVTNGTYAAGGRAVFGAMTNRVAIDRAITVQSVNGPGATFIRGAYAPGTTTGDGAIRCAYLTNGAALIGFTITNGATRTSGDISRELCGGGLWCEAASSVVSNCVLVGNLANRGGGGVYGGLLTNCTLMNNCATQITGTGMSTQLGEGGGAYLAMLNNCLLATNIAYDGGGASQCALAGCTFGTNSATANGGAASYGTLQNCTLTGNTAVGSYSSGGGGGVYSAALTNCILSGNHAVGGGGASGGILDHCTLTNNSASYGGGMLGSTLYHCLLTGNSVPSGGGAGESGGGAIYGTLTSCVLTGNWTYSGSYGGGAYDSTLNNCILTANRASWGAGAAHGVLINCTVTGNLGFNGGGVYDATVTNCILYANTGTGNGSNYFYDVLSAGNSIDHSCTTPQPGGLRNITNDPAFVDFAGGNLHLQSNSPCINGGNNTAVTNSLDFDGNPRIAGGTVDIGAYEFQNPGSKLSYAWLQQYGFPADGSADFADPDGDGMNNWQEWHAGTDPTNALSVLRILSVTTTANGAIVRWQSVANQPYILQLSSNPGAPNSFFTYRSNIPGAAGTTSLTNNFMNPNGPFYFRIGVQ